MSFGRSRFSIASLIAAAVALALLLSRLVRIDLAPFVYDEPKFMMAAWEQIVTGEWVDHSTLVSGPLRYGPTPFWFFALLQLLFGQSAETLIFTVGLVVTLSQLLLILVLHDGSRTRSTWALAGVLLIAASSPYEFFYGRLAWDLFTNFGPFVALALIASEDFGPLKGTLLGAWLGLCISAHPMVTPFVLAVFAVLAVSRLGSLGHRALTLGAALVACVVVNIPWIHYLMHVEFVVPGQQNAGFSFTAQRFLESYRPHSFWGIQYFFDDDWAAFVAKRPWLGWPRVQDVSLALSAFVTVAGLVALALNRLNLGFRRVGLVGLLCAFGYPVFFSRLQLFNHPHYQFPVVWLTVAGAAGIFYARSKWTVPVRALAIALAVMNLAFIASWADFIVTRTGTRGVHYSTPVGEQLRFVRAACEARGKAIHVINETVIYPFPLEQHFKVERACRGKRLEICGSDHCRNAAAAEAVFRLQYRDPEGGALAWTVEPLRAARHVP